MKIEGTYAKSGVAMETLMARYMAHHGLSRHDAEAWLLDQGLRRAVALAVNNGAEWPGIKANRRAPAPGRKAKKGAK